MAKIINIHEQKILHTKMKIIKILLSRDKFSATYVPKSKKKKNSLSTFLNDDSMNFEYRKQEILITNYNYIKIIFK